MSANNSNFNQVLWLSIGQVCTFILSFLTAPILARYFDKVEYGTYRQILYVYTTMTSLFTMGLPSVFAYFIPRLQTGQQKKLIQGLNRIFLLLGALFSISLFCLADVIAGLLNNPELAVGIRLFSPFPLFTLPTMGVEGIYTALKKTKTIAIYQVISQTAMIICIIIPVVFFKTSYREAIIGWGIAAFLRFMVSIYLKNKPYVHVSPELVPNMYRTVFSYSFPLMGAFIAGFFISSADQFFISRYYGSSTFAEFSNGCLSIPIVGMVATSVKSVLLPLFSKADAEHKLGEAVVSYNNALTKTATIIIPMLLFCMFFASDVMVALYGSQYEVSQHYFQMYILRDFFKIVPYFAVLMALGYSKIYMHMHVIGAVLIWCIDFCIVHLGGDAPLIVLVSSLFDMSCRVFACVYIYQNVHINLVPKYQMKYVLIIFLHCLFCLSILTFVHHVYMPTVNAYLSLAIFMTVFYILITISGRLFKINYLEFILLAIKLQKGKR